jgi:hypothetical protein
MNDRTDLGVTATRWPAVLGMWMVFDGAIRGDG